VERCTSGAQDVFLPALSQAETASIGHLDTLILVQSIYRCFREKRLGEVVDLLSDDFRFLAQLPDDMLEDINRPRSRAEIALLAHRSMEEFDILTFEPGAIRVSDDFASTETEVKFRHKKTGKVLETRFVHDWRIADGKVCELEQRHDLAQLRAFAESLESTDA
jgi:ketosteroid isomerase-like protein